MKNFLLSVDFIRDSWLNFFEEKGYNFIPSSSLIPDDDDKSLLWINSGVASLKKYFSSDEKINFVNCQKVIRTEDLIDKEDFSDESKNFFYHQTLFEMLGVFSVNSNFKEHTITNIWDFFTSDHFLGLDKNNLFVTVWEEDCSVINIWKNVGISEEMIIFGNKKSNFWDMGDGPCGSNTEIYFDFYPDKIKPNISEIESNKDRFIEICNIVFPEYYHNKKDDSYTDLKKKCVDVGAGLERIAMVLQKKKNVFDIDVWDPVIKLMKNFYFSSKLDNNSSNNNEKENLEDRPLNNEKELINQSFFIIADHLRTIIFSLSDGAKIDSKGRGYILKKLLKRVCVESIFLSFNEKNIEDILNTLIFSNSFFYPNLKKKNEELVKIIVAEFIKFIEILRDCDRKMDLFFRKNIFDEHGIFFLYDTMGIPLKIVKKYFLKKNKFFPKEDFFILLKKQKDSGSKDRKEKNMTVF